MGRPRGAWPFQGIYTLQSRRCQATRNIELYTRWRSILQLTLLLWTHSPPGSHNRNAVSTLDRLENRRTHNHFRAVDPPLSLPPTNALSTAPCSAAPLLLCLRQTPIPPATTHSLSPSPTSPTTRSTAEPIHTISSITSLPSPMRQRSSHSIGHLTALPQHPLGRPLQWLAGRVASPLLIRCPYHGGLDGLSRP